MLNPFILSAMFGFLKGTTKPGGPAWGPEGVQANVMAPLLEEAAYRAAPHYLFGGFPMGVTATVFAADHVWAENGRYGLDGTHALMRFADVLLGGLLYESAFRRWGYLGAVASHAVHNVMCGVGSSAAGRLGARPPPERRLLAQALHPSSRYVGEVSPRALLRQMTPHRLAVRRRG